MNTKITNAQHASAAAEPLHLRLRSRAVAGIMAGCLTVMLCPAAAFAAPADMGSQAASQTGAPAMQQPFDQQGQQDQQSQQGFNAGQAQSDTQAPANNQALADNQMPGGDQQSQNQNQNVQQPGGQPMSSQMDDQIRQYLQSTFNITMPALGDDANGLQAGDGQMGAPSEAPEIPEGEINVQAVIDSVHDIIRQYGVEALESADFTDADFQAKLAEYVQTAMQQRLEMFRNGSAPANMEQPSDLPAPADMVAEAAQNALEGAPANAPEGAPTDRASAGAVSDTLLGTLIDFIEGLF